MSVILIVDDSSFQRRIIRNVVEGEGHQVLEAVDGRDALKVLAQNVPDCILMDLIMPEVSGLAILKDLNAQKSKIPVIVITADIQESVHKKCMDLGAAAVLNKPTKGEEVLNAIQKSLLSKKGVEK